MELSKEAWERINKHYDEIKAISDPMVIARLIIAHGENYADVLRKYSIEHEQDIANATEYDCFLHIPHDLDGEHLVLDSQAFDVIRRWNELPAETKDAMHGMVMV